MTRGDLKRHAQLELGLDRVVGTDEDLLLNDWCQDAVYDFLTETHVRLVATTINLTAGTGDYSMLVLSSTIMEIADLYYTSGGQIYGLERVNLQAILDMRRTTSALDRARYYALEGDMFAVYPTPAANDTLTAYAVIKPTALGNDSNDLAAASFGGIPVQYHPTLLAYVLMRGARYEGSRINPKQGPEYEDNYKKEIAKARKKIRSMGGRSLPGISAGYPRQASKVVVRNDIY